MSNYQKYKDLLSKTYDEAVNFLLRKYGPAQDDYYRESSYQRFMDGEIKNITKGKYSRTKEGLYCHHIDEIKDLNISNQAFIKKYKYSFEYQKKERLVFCDLIEHTILHVLITEETSEEFGYPGYLAHLKPLIELWYLDEIIPKPKWMKNCYNKSFLNPQNAFYILKDMQKVLGKDYYKNISDYYEEIKKRKKEKIQFKKRIEQRRKDERILSIKSAQLLHNKSSRQEIVHAIYYLKYKKNRKFPSIEYECEYKEFDRKMKIYPKDEILEELKKYLASLPEVDAECGGNL